MMEQIGEKESDSDTLNEEKDGSFVDEPQSTLKGKEQDSDQSASTFRDNFLDDWMVLFAKRRRIGRSPADKFATDQGKSLEEVHNTKTESREREQQPRTLVGTLASNYRSIGRNSGAVMATKARHEVTSLSAFERNRILESMHGVLADEEDKHKGCGIDQLSGKGETSGAITSSAPEQPNQKESNAGSSCKSIFPSDDLSENAGDIEYFASRQNTLVQAGGHTLDNGNHTEGPISRDLQQMQDDDPLERERFVADKLKELDAAIGRIQQKIAYDQAVNNSDAYVTNPKFRLVFLRANRYDSAKAAERLVSFMEEKLKRFGPHALNRQLTIDDLGGTAKSLIIKKGVVQLLPARDSSGRAILVAYYQVSQLHEEFRKDPKALGDAIFYLMSAMSEDEETQRRGIVTIVVISSTPRQETEDADIFLHTTLQDLGSNIYSWCPLKCNAHHHWIHDSSTDHATHTSVNHQYESIDLASLTRQTGRVTSPIPLSASSISGAAIFDTIIGCLGKEYRIRTRLHEGSFKEFQEVLKTFGIPVDYLPFSMDGSEIRVSGAHTKWIQKRRQKEAQLILCSKSGKDEFIHVGKAPPPCSIATDTTKEDISTITPSCFDVIDIPGRHDVCLGRGTTLHQHSGNVAMRAMMEPLVDEYENATSTRRQELNKVIIQAVQIIGGRFLSNKTSDGAWFEEVADDAVVEKSIGGIFRSMVSRVNAQKKSSSRIMPNSNNQN